MTHSVNLDKLDHWLLSDHSPESSFLLSDLDGFLHGVACAPVHICSDLWLTTIFGKDLGAVPDWVLEALTGLLSDIKLKLRHQPQSVEPIFWKAPEGHVIAMDWCEGFMESIKLCPREWLRLQESGTDGHLMTPILVHILDDNGNSVMGIPQEELDAALEEAANQIPEAVACIFNYWRG